MPARRSGRAAWRGLHAAALAAGASLLLTGFTAPPPTPARGAPPTLPPIAFPHDPVPSYRQQLSNDCEATALRMILAGRGIARSDRQLLSSIGVDLKHPHYGYSGPTSGDPYRAFVGSPNGSESGGSGYGVFYPPVAAAAAANGVRVLAAQEHYPAAQLYAQLGAGHLAEVWIDYLWRARSSTSYRAYDGRWIPYAGPAEHAITLVGVTANGVLVNDPARGHYWISKSRFRAGWSTYRDMAVVVD